MTISRVLASALLCCAGCGTAATAPVVESLPPIEPAVLRASLTPEVAALLDRDSRFPEAVAPDLGFPQPTTAEVRVIAERLVRAIVPSSAFARELVADAGAPIQFGVLAACGRVEYAAMPWDSVPQALRLEGRTYAGPHRLVTLCTPAGVPQVSLSVAALTPVRATSSGLDFSQGGTGDLFAYGIPRGRWDGALPVSAERAVLVASARTGRRAAAAPELMLPPLGLCRQAAQWCVRLEAPVTLPIDGGRTVETQVVFVGLAVHPRLADRVQLHVADPADPASVTLPGRFSIDTLAPVTLTRRSDRPSQYVAVLNP